MLISWLLSAKESKNFAQWESAALLGLFRFLKKKLSTEF
jgi:hypothetical protein